MNRDEEACLKKQTKSNVEKKNYAYKVKNYEYRKIHVPKKPLKLCFLIKNCQLSMLIWTLQLTFSFDFMETSG